MTMNEVSSLLRSQTQSRLYEAGWPSVGIADIISDNDGRLAWCRGWMGYGYPMCVTCANADSNDLELHASRMFYYTLVSLPVSIGDVREPCYGYNPCACWAVGPEPEGDRA